MRKDAHEQGPLCGSVSSRCAVEEQLPPTNCPESALESDRFMPTFCAWSTDSGTRAMQSMRTDFDGALRSRVLGRCGVCDLVFMIGMGLLERTASVNQRPLITPEELTLPTPKSKTRCIP